MGSNYVWGGSLDGDWNTASNWLVSGDPASAPPGASDNVTIASSGSTITITGSGALQERVADGHRAGRPRRYPSTPQA